MIEHVKSEAASPSNTTRLCSIERSTNETEIDLFDQTVITFKVGRLLVVFHILLEQIILLVRSFAVQSENYVP